MVVPALVALVANFLLPEWAILTDEDVHEYLFSSPDGAVLGRAVPEAPLSLQADGRVQDGQSC